MSLFRICDETLLNCTGSFLDELDQIATVQISIVQIDEYSMQAALYVIQSLSDTPS